MAKEKMTSEERAKAISAAIATFRKDNESKIDGDKFSLPRLWDGLRDLDCPYANEVKNVLSQNKLVYKLPGGLYKFVDGPIHYQKIESLINAYLINFKNKKSNKINQEIAQSRVITKEIIVDNALKEQIESSIEFLKQHGYKVMKQIITFEEC